MKIEINNNLKIKYLLHKLNLDAYGVHTTINNKNYGDNCLIKSLETAGHDTTAIRCLCRNQSIPMKDLKKISNLLNVYITIRRLDDEKKKEHYGNKNNTEIKIGLINKHYFLIEEIPYTLFSIKNYSQLNKIPDWNKIYCIEKNKNNEKIYKKKIIDILIVIMQLNI